MPLTPFRPGGGASTATVTLTDADIAVLHSDGFPLVPAEVSGMRAWPLFVSAIVRYSSITIPGSPYLTVHAMQSVAGTLASDGEKAAGTVFLMKPDTNQHQSSIDEAGYYPITLRTSGSAPTLPTVGAIDTFDILESYGWSAGQRFRIPIGRGDAAITVDTVSPGFLITAIDKTTSLAITGVDVVAQTFTVAGDRTAEFPVGSLFVVEGSTGNDNEYSVVSATFDTDHTDIIVAYEGDLPDATADGTIPRHSVTVTGDASTLDGSQDSAAIYGDGFGVLFLGESIVSATFDAGSTVVLIAHSLADGERIFTPGLYFGNATTGEAGKILSYTVDDAGRGYYEAESVSGVPIAPAVGGVEIQITAIIPGDNPIELEVTTTYVPVVPSS